MPSIFNCFSRLFLVCFALSIMATASNSDCEEYFPTPLPTPAVVTSTMEVGEPVPTSQPTRRVLLSEGVVSPSGRSRSLSPPILLPVLVQMLTSDVEQVRHQALHGLLLTKFRTTAPAGVSPWFTPYPRVLPWEADACYPVN